MIRKKRVIIFVIIIVLLALLILLGALGIYLYKTTDMFKSTDLLFRKYLSQNVNILDKIEIKDTSGVKKQMETNKYISNLTGNIEYTENIQTSDENKNNPVNSQTVKVSSNIDKANNYLYRNVSIIKDEEKLAGLEYLQHEKNYAIRVNGIQQFLSSNNLDDLKNFGIDNIELLNADINLSQILNFSDSEKETIKHSIINICQENLSSNKFYKQKNVTIKQNDKSVYTNLFSVDMTYEEYNNLLIKVLENLKENQTILSKIELINGQIKELYPSYSDNLKDEFVSKIEEKINNIKDNNIGNDTVKITVYENSMKTVRTVIEKNDGTITLDNSGTTIKLNVSKTGNQSEEKEIRYTINGDDNISVAFSDKENDKITKELLVNYLQTVNGSNVKRTYEIEIENEKYQGKFNIDDEIQFVTEFDNSLLENSDNLEINKLNSEQKTSLYEVVKGVVLEQSTNANIQNYNDIFEKLDIIKKEKVDQPVGGQISDIEKKRFNSQFEFFESQGLSSDNVTDLIQAVTDNIQDIKIQLKDGSIEDINIDKLESNKQSKDYINSISAIVIYVKKDTTNKEKIEQSSTLIEKLKNSKFDVSLEYDGNELVKTVFVKIEEEKK